MASTIYKATLKLYKIKQPIIIILFLEKPFKEIHTYLGKKNMWKKQIKTQ